MFTSATACVSSAQMQDATSSRRSGKGHTSFMLLSGLLFSSGIGLLAYRRHSLSRNGVFGAVVTGTTTFGLGGWPWGLALIYFFTSSSLFSHFRVRDKASIAEDKYSKGSQRDLAQVVANGCVATILALGYGLTDSPSLGRLCLSGYTGALATATADTWATELGVLSPQQPRLITTGAPVTPGTSGGITLLGTTAAAVGAFSLGLVFWLLHRLRRAYAFLPSLALISGLAAALLDSVLGATVQTMYYCPTCQQETERRIHTCNTPTYRLRGLPGMNNDMVNFLTTLFGAVVAMLFSLVRDALRTF